MEITIGRALEKHEVVHHIDGNPSNNSPDNLMVLKSQSEHASLENSRGYKDEYNKQCSCCKAIKPRTEFAKCSIAGWDVSHSLCKQCKREKRVALAKRKAIDPYL
jgi:hypothetical protein